MGHIGTYMFPQAETIQFDEEEMMDLPRYSDFGVSMDTEPKAEKTQKSGEDILADFIGDMPGDDEEGETDLFAIKAESDENIAAANEEKNESFASVQSKEIVADAEKTAEQIVAKATAQAQKIIEDAEREMEQKAQLEYKAARDKGYAEGLEEGRGNADEQTQKQVADFLLSATEAREKMMEDAQEDLCNLTLSIAEKVMQISLKSSKDIIARMILVATEKLKRREWVHIYVNESDAGVLAESSLELAQSLESLSDNIRIVPLPDSEQGTCIIEMPDEIIDAGVSTQLKNIQSEMEHFTKPE